MNGPTDPDPGMHLRLAEFERRARDAAELATRDAGAWSELAREIQHSGLRAEFPLLDPDEARTSSAELVWLIEALGSQPTSQAQQALTPFESTPDTLSRVGYAIEGQPGGHDARVRPAFAESLARRLPPDRLRKDFPDLWAVDFALWRRLVEGLADPRSLSRGWLASPGRRLVQELPALRFNSTTADLGASDFSSEALRAAAGPLPTDTAVSGAGFEEWRELHGAVPGRAFMAWNPARVDVGGVLRILEGRRGDPVFLRGAALAWLLERAATEPFYALDGIERDLREDLVPVLISAFPIAAGAHPDDTLQTEHRAAVRLETAALHHAVRLARLQGATSEEPTARCWSLARWLHACTFRSPYFGGDEEALAARLRALLPAEPLIALEDEDILHPSRFQADGTGLDLTELALVAGASWHYQPGTEDDPSRPRLFPTPLPLVNALRRLASRTLNEQERQAEAVLQAWRSAVDAREPQELIKGNALGWWAHHIAPPLVARWLMTYHHIAWLQHVDAAARRESLELFQRAPEQHEWVAFAFHAEGSELPVKARSEAAETWRAVRTERGTLGGKAALTLMAAGILDALPEEDQRGLAMLSRTAEVAWRHQSLEALASAAERWSQVEVWKSAVEALLEMMDDEGLEGQERLKAALLALKRLSATSRVERKGYLARLARSAERPPFNQNVALRRELRRLGVVSSGSRGGL